ncbi:copper transporter [Mycena leptocephala]|nr:copper transporter [Mycena leptocephala]
MSSSANYSGDTLHWSLEGNHVLFSFIQLDSFGGFVLGALFTATLCGFERLLTFAFERQWGPASMRRSRGMNALWRAGMYWVLAALRLAYMLIAMTMNAGLILVTVTTLALGQFFIELRTPPQARDRGYAPLEEAPMYTMPSCEDVSTFQRGARAKSKPEEIFIHPTQSNVACADAALSTDRIQGTRYPHEAAAWEAGKGPDVARSLLGNTKRGSVGPRRAPFQIGGDDDQSDSDS